MYVVIIITSDGLRFILAVKISSNKVLYCRILSSLEFSFGGRNNFLFSFWWKEAITLGSSQNDTQVIWLLIFTVGQNLSHFFFFFFSTNSAISQFQRQIHCRENFTERKR